MRRKPFLFLLPLLALACSRDAEVGLRYRAEREIWNLNREVRRLAIKPELVNEATWRALAARYEGIASSYAKVEARPGEDKAALTARDIRAIVARAHISAAQVYAAVGDSAQMLSNYEQVVSGFQDVPALVAEVSLAQGAIAEGKREWEQAATAYESIVAHIEPEPGDAGVGGAVMELPLRIARLRATATPADSAGFYEKARTQYQHWIDSHPGTLVDLQARARLADIAAERGDWATALQMLRRLEADLARQPEPQQDPATIRLAMANVQLRAQAPAESTQATLLSLLRDYPKSAVAPQALLGLATFAARNHQVDVALGYLDRLRDEYPNAEEANANGMLTRGRILEADGRWPEAADVFKALPVQHPLSEAALLAPLETVAHYQRAENAEETKAALVRAEGAYREFVQRYPPGRMTLSARAKLVQTLVLQKRFEDAITELLSMSDDLRGQPQGAALLLDAARIAHGQLGDSTRAAEILERLATRYPNMSMGRWAKTEVARLRGG
jgi:TolA-binding protein